jgi:type IV pilus assembly protein PilB
MRAADATVLQILLDAEKIELKDVKKLQEQAKSERRAMQDIVVKNGTITDRELTKLYAKVIEVPYVELNPSIVSKDALKQIPERIARQYNVVLFDVDEKNRHLAMEDPDDVQAIDYIKKKLGHDIRVYVSCKEDIMGALDLYRENITSEISDVITGVDNSKIDEEVDEADLAEDSPIAQTVNLILEYAIKTGASDIHIEPRDDHIQVRYRQDGVLKEANKLPKNALAALVSRIKILSNLKIDERRSPQDGRFKIELNGRVFAFRVSTLPLVDGEKVVMRVLDESTEPLSLEKLGFWGEALARINRAIVQPHGMILVTGPTGSGKSTTLQSVLNILNSPDVNISTVEDPVEYRLEGVNQTQVNNKAGMTFANGLRALLRQDPNIIMVGEIRDTETASLGVQAALTGHLVFSTLHTNNAATCLPRLLDMGIEPFLIASTVRVVIGQRLVRRINADECELYRPDSTELKEIEHAFGIKGESDWKKLFAMAKQADETSDLRSVSDIQLYRPKTDASTIGNGYKGRMGIYEVLENTSDIQKLIVTSGTSDVIQAAAESTGMLTMHVDGLVKALIGWTSIEEILRVTRE